MASEIHEIEIARRLSTGTHIFIPPLTWNLAVVGSAAHLVTLIQQSGRDAKIVANPAWRDCIPDSWPNELWVYPEELCYDFQERPQWTWLWGLGHTKQHSQELNNFLLGLDSIQILDWTSDRVRRRGQFFHDCGYLGGLTELSFVISRDLWPVYNWESPCLGDALRYYMQQYPMTCLDAPLIHMAGQLELSELEKPELPELAELRRHEDWSVQVFKQLDLPLKQAMQLYSMQLHRQDSAENLLLALEDELGRCHFQIMTPQVDLELKLRKCLLAKVNKHNLGGFELAEVDVLMECLEEALGLADSEIKKVKPWPSANYEGDHFSFACEDPQWEIERDNRLHTDEIIEEEDPEEEEDEVVNETLDWNANQLIHRLKHLKLPTLKLTRRDLVVAHLPIVKLGEDDLKETHDRLEDERQAELQRQFQAMLEAKEEKERLERERLEAEKREKELEAEKLRQAEEARVQAEAERLAEEERLKLEAEQQAAEAERLRIEQEEQEAEAERQRIEEEERAAEEAERLEIEAEERAAEEEQRALEEAELEAERAKREGPKDDYLHSDKEGWGADEEEKDEAEELLESFQQLDRDHPAEEKEFYDEEERLDDSMGIEHPSYEMFDEEEKEDDDEQAQINAALLEDEEEDLEPEELLEELDPEDEEDLDAEELKPEEILSQLEEKDSSEGAQDEKATSVQEIETSISKDSTQSDQRESAGQNDGPQEKYEEATSISGPVKGEQEAIEESPDKLETEKVPEVEEQAVATEEIPKVRDDVEEESGAAEEEPKSIEQETASEQEEQVDEVDEAPIAEGSAKEEPEASQEDSEEEVEAEQSMSAEEILDQLEDSVEIINLDPTSVIDDEEEYDEEDEEDVEWVELGSASSGEAETQPSFEEVVEEPAAAEPDIVDHATVTEVVVEEPQIEFEEPDDMIDSETAADSEEEEFHEASDILNIDEIEFEPDAADVTKVYVNTAEFEEYDEDGASYEFDVEEAFVDDEDTTRSGLEELESKVETKEHQDISEPIATTETDVATPPAAAPIAEAPKAPEPIQETKIGRKTPTGYINPYLWDHHDKVNDLLTEVRQTPRLRKGDVAYVAIVAVVLVWAHLNQLPFI